MGTTFYKSLLSPQGRKAYNTLFESFQMYTPEIDLPNTPSDLVSRALSAVRLDTPTLFFLDNLSTVCSCGNDSRLEVKFTYPLEDIKTLLNEINQIADKVVSATRGMQEQQIATYLHDYLVKNLTYSDALSFRNEAYSIVGALIHHRCVCEGYAKAYKFLCDRAGIRCIVVHGTAMGSDGTWDKHAWNMVRIGQYCYHVDVTFDNYIDGEYCSKAHLFLSDKEALVTHQVEDLFTVPQCPRSLLPMPRASGVDELVVAIERDYHRKLRHSEYALSTYVQSDKLIDAVSEKLIASNRALYRHIDGFFCSKSKKVNVIGINWK